ncbi:MAG: cupin domain-containing protein [Gemmatimonadetes bacterium]|nr:cupin domain-containing protein [Gemmatimonadota bacterium]
MIIIRHEDQPWEEWRPGVFTRAWSGACFGSKEMMMGEQKFAPGAQSPLHWHYSEEQVTVISGRAEAWCDDDTEIAEAGTTLVFPRQSMHGFMNIGDDELHIVGGFPWPFLEAYFKHDPPGVVTREYEAWEGGHARKLYPTQVDALGGPGPQPHPGHHHPGHHHRGHHEPGHHHPA